MNPSFLKELKENYKNIGIIANYLSKQFLEKDFNIFQVPNSNFREYMEINEIELLLIDNDIYENDHIWFGKELGGFLAHLKLHEIKVIVIKNSQKSILNLFYEYPIIEIDIDHKEKTQNYNSVTIPIALNEHKFNPIKSIKKIDVIYLNKGKLSRTENIQKFHSVLNPKREEIVFDNLSRKLLLEIFEKIKQSKCLYIYNAHQFDKVFLKYLELIAILQNTVVFYFDNRVSTEFSFVDEEEAILNFVTIMKEDEYYMDKALLPLQRKVFINNTFIHYNSLYELALKTEREIEVSVITSTNRKSNLNDYIKRLVSQNIVKLQVILVTHGFKLSKQEKSSIYKKAKDIDLEILEVPNQMPLGYCLNSAIARTKYPYVAKMDDDDYYYSNYLIDSWISAKYSNADLVGKFSTYTFFEGSGLVVSRHKNTRRKYYDFVMGATFFCKSSTMKKYMFSFLPTGEDSDFLRRIKEDKAVIYADHPYNFCIYRSNNLESHTWKITDLEFMKNANIESHHDPQTFLSI
ncbi:hypothetical protein FO441_00965 [Salinicoccus cyprini]|uniref:Glycosyltransferase family 2 protein n=1 Tax=Salinicoccus cyprini TaxID=2493691 RepID=A0A558AX92_9STAP|nr:hypothetical protein [Salinicoccus cyprini]TVT28882.1 hypothetical protein FO441_00965 [Salinicoccus cyprini]